MQANFSESRVIDWITTVARNKSWKIFKSYIETSRRITREETNYNNDLAEHKPSISEDFDSLASYIFKFAVNSGETYKRNFEKMKEYINECFKEGGTVCVMAEHDFAIVSLVGSGDRI